MADQERPGAELRRKKGQPWVLNHGVKWQWLYLTVWHGEEEFLAHFHPWSHGLNTGKSSKSSPNKSNSQLNNLLLINLFNKLNAFQLSLESLCLKYSQIIIDLFYDKTRKN